MVLLQTASCMQRAGWSVSALVNLASLITNGPESKDLENDTGAVDWKPLVRMVLSFIDVFCASIPGHRLPLSVKLVS